MNTTTATYQKLIVEAIKGLPSATLAEIADFVYFVRKKALQPKTFNEELQNALLELDLKLMSRSEEAHLEKEFEDYARR
ncbi:MAG: hypothetical protein ACE5IR_27355 [bacterium]